MIYLDVVSEHTELIDGLTLAEPRLYVWTNGGSVAYVPLEPNPLGHKARVIITNADGQIEIENYTRRSVALWEYADYTDEPEQLMDEASELYERGF
jgi:hypothetical protein